MIHQLMLMLDQIDDFTILKAAAVVYILCLVIMNLLEEK